MNFKLKSSLFIIVLILFVSTDFLTSQVIKVDTITVKKSKTIRILKMNTIPKFILGISGYYNSGNLELSANNGGFSRNDFKVGKKYGARNGMGISLIGKLPLDKKGRFWLDGISSYNYFLSNLIANNTEEGDIRYHVFSGGIGAEYNFTPANKVKYFIGVNSLFSFISGNAKIIEPDPADTNININYNVKINSNFRIGYSAFIGLEYAFDRNVGINAGLKFTHANLLLKKTTSSTSIYETELNDQSVVPSQLYSGWKQFAFSSVFAGFSYYFGVKERKYKLP
jgi:opacity protein-like surface antigen